MQARELLLRNIPVVRAKEIIGTYGSGVPREAPCLCRELAVWATLLYGPAPVTANRWCWCLLKLGTYAPILQHLRQAENPAREWRWRPNSRCCADERGSSPKTTAGAFERSAGHFRHRPGRNQRCAPRLLPGIQEGVHVKQGMIALVRLASTDRTGPAGATAEIHAVRPFWRLEMPRAGRNVVCTRAGGIDRAAGLLRSEATDPVVRSRKIRGERTSTDPYRACVKCRLLPVMRTASLAITVARYTSSSGSASPNAVSRRARPR